MHTAPLVESGVLTGKYKKTLSGIGGRRRLRGADAAAELDRIDGDPRYQLYDFNFTDDIRLIAKEEGLISINNALALT